MKFLKRKLLNLLVRNLLKGFTADTILRVGGNTNNPDIYLDNRKLSPDEIRRLKNEAIAYRQMLLYEVLQKTPERKAIKSLVEQVGKEEDLFFCKAVLYVVKKIQEELLNRISNW